MIDCDLNALNLDVFASMPSLESFQIERLESNPNLAYSDLKQLTRLVIFDLDSCFKFLFNLPSGLRVLRVNEWSRKATTLTCLRHSELETLDIENLSVDECGNFDPVCLNDLSALKHLRVQKNHLERIDLDRLAIQRLSSLSLAWNEIERLDWFKLVNLKSLDLSYNSSLVFESEMFASLEGLEQLFLESVEFDGSVERVFVNMKSLRVLDLSFNLLKAFERKVFEGLTKLTRLDLKYNKLVALDKRLVVELFPKLEKLDLNDFKMLDDNNNYFFGQ